MIDAGMVTKTIYFAKRACVQGWLKFAPFPVKSFYL